MKLTWQHLVLIATSLAAIILAAKFGNVTMAAVGGVVTTVIGVFLRSPQDAKELDK